MNSRIRSFLLTGLLALAASPLVFCTVSAGDTKNGGEIERIGPEETRKMVASGDALLICSYNDNRCKSILIEGAILRSELDDRVPDLPMGQSLIFYCG